MRSALLIEFMQAISPEAALFRHLKAGIELALHRNEPRSLGGNRLRPGIFRPLLLGFNGAANTGADVRVIEILRQFNAIFSHIPFEPVLIASGRYFGHTAFESVRKLHLTSYFPDFLAECAESYTGVIACEGSMLTSTFSDSMAGIFAGGLGHATALGHLGVGYGAEVANMSPSLEDFVRLACKDVLVIARSDNSLSKLKNLGLRAEAGADPAWTFEPADHDDHDMLRQAGWDGKAPLAVLCPINPFCWPLAIDLEKARTPAIYAEQRFNDISFHSWSIEAAKKYDVYLASFAELATWLKQHKYFPVLVGMQDIDKKSCDRLNRLLGIPLPLFIRGSSSIDSITAVLHRADLIVSSRYHATVIGMSGGAPCIGVSMDSRIDSLFSEAGLSEWTLPCDAESLGENLIRLAAEAGKSRDALGHLYGRLAAKQIRAFGNMGSRILAEAAAVYSDFPANPRATGWDTCLPHLSPRVEGILQCHA